MKHYYENVPRLGNVAVSRHAQSQMQNAGISQEAFDRALLDPTQPDAPDGQDILWRERDGLRLVILTNPTPNRGAKLVKTVYRVQAQASALRIVVRLALRCAEAPPWAVSSRPPERPPAALHLNSQVAGTLALSPGVNFGAQASNALWKMLASVKLIGSEK